MDQFTIQRRSNKSCREEILVASVGGYIVPKNDNVPMHGTYDVIFPEEGLKYKPIKGVFKFTNPTEIRCCLYAAYMALSTTLDDNRDLLVITKNKDLVKSVCNMSEKSTGLVGSIYKLCKNRNVTFMIS